MLGEGDNMDSFRGSYKYISAAGGCISSSLLNYADQVKMEAWIYTFNEQSFRNRISCYHLHNALQHYNY